MVQQFLVHSSHSPIQTLLNWHIYRLWVHYNSTTPSHIMQQGMDELLYKKLCFIIGNFYSFIHGLVKIIQGLLDELLFYIANQPPPMILQGQLYDNPIKGKTSQSFLYNSQMTWPIDGQQWLINYIQAKPTLQAQFIQTYCCHPLIIQAYFQQVITFKEKLIVYIHIYTSQLSYTPKLLSIQYVNTNTNIRWNIYINNGIVALVTVYHKGFYTSNNVKIIY